MVEPVFAGFPDLRYIFPPVRHPFRWCFVILQIVCKLNRTIAGLYILCAYKGVKARIEWIFRARFEFFLPQIVKNKGKSRNFVA